MPYGHISRADAMLTFDQLWGRLCELDETVQIEAKSGQQLGRSLLETISSFSNEPGRGGGYLLLGVRPVGGLRLPAYEIVGVSDPDRMQADLASQCRTLFNRPVRPVIQVESRDGKPVVIAWIPEAARHDKPIYIESRGLPKGAYRRIGSTDHRCTDDDLSVLYEARGNQSLDESVLPHADVTDFEPKAVAEYRAARARLNPDAAELQFSDAELLRSVGAVAHVAGRLVPTMAGLVLFGTNTSIRRHLPAMRLDYIRVPGRDWVRSPEVRFESLEILAPLLLGVPRAISSVLDDIPTSFKLSNDSLQREDVPLVPRTALREAIVNAVMHRSYRNNQPVQVIRYSNRLEIRNPGVSLVPDDRLGEPGSTQRNPRIAAVLHDSGFAETKGSGIRAIREAMNQANLSPPTFESDRDRDGFVVTFLFHQFLSADDIVWLDNFRHLRLTEDEQRALVYAREVGVINNAAYRDLNRVESLVASSRLGRLKDFGLLEQHGTGAAASYRPTAAITGPLQSPISAISAGGSLVDREIPTKLPPHLKGLPTKLATEVMALRPRAQPHELGAIVTKLCSWQPHTSVELARILRRSRHYLTAKVLRQLVEAGILEFTCPETLRHPKQGYRVRRSSQ